MEKGDGGSERRWSENGMRWRQRRWEGMRGEEVSGRKVREGEEDGRERDRGRGGEV